MHHNKRNFISRCPSYLLFFNNRIYINNFLLNGLNAGLYRDSTIYLLCLFYGNRTYDVDEFKKMIYENDNKIIEFNDFPFHSSFEFENYNNDLRKIKNILITKETPLFSREFTENIDLKNIRRRLTENNTEGKTVSAISKTNLSREKIIISQDRNISNLSKEGHKNEIENKISNKRKFVTLIQQNKSTSTACSESEEVENTKCFHLIKSFFPLRFSSLFNIREEKKIKIHSGK